MMEEGEGEGAEDNVRRGTDEAEEEPQVMMTDVFDELLGTTSTTTTPVVTTSISTSTTTTSTLLPWSPPRRNKVRSCLSLLWLW